MRAHLEVRLLHMREHGTRMDVLLFLLFLFFTFLYLWRTQATSRI